MNIIKQALFCLILLGSVITPRLAIAQVDPLDGACSEGTAAASGVCEGRNQTDNPISGPNGIILKIVDIISFIVGAAAVIMIIVSGIKLVTSQGDANAVKSGRNSLLYALIGVVVVIMARTIITYVVKKV